MLLTPHPTGGLRRTPYPKSTPPGGQSFSPETPTQSFRSGTPDVRMRAAPVVAVSPSSSSCRATPPPPSPGHTAFRPARRPRRTAAVGRAPFPRPPGLDEHASVNQPVPQQLRQAGTEGEGPECAEQRSRPLSPSSPSQRGFHTVTCPEPAQSCSPAGTLVHAVHDGAAIPWAGRSLKRESPGRQGRWRTRPPEHDTRKARRSAETPGNPESERAHRAPGSDGVRPTTVSAHPRCRTDASTSTRPNGCRPSLLPIQTDTCTSVSLPVLCVNARRRSQTYSVLPEPRRKPWRWGLAPDVQRMRISRGPAVPARKRHPAPRRRSGFPGPLVQRVAQRSGGRARGGRTLAPPGEGPVVRRRWCAHPPPQEQRYAGSQWRFSRPSRPLAAPAEAGVGSPLTGTRRPRHLSFGRTAAWVAGRPNELFSDGAVRGDASRAFDRAMRFTIHPATNSCVHISSYATIIRFERACTVNVGLLCFRDSDSHLSSAFTTLVGGPNSCNPCPMVHVSSKWRMYIGVRLTAATNVGRVMSVRRSFSGPSQKKTDRFRLRELLENSNEQAAYYNVALLGSYPCRRRGFLKILHHAAEECTFKHKKQVLMCVKVYRPALILYPNVDR
ncbi:hypothetical protein Trydic_g9924 [Trypoxylus dichotomus]